MRFTPALLCSFLMFVTGCGEATETDESSEALSCTGHGTATASDGKIFCFWKDGTGWRAICPDGRRSPLLNYEAARGYCDSAQVAPGCTWERTSIGATQHFSVCYCGSETYTCNEHLSTNSFLCERGINAQCRANRTGPQRIEGDSTNPESCLYACRPRNRVSCYDGFGGAGEASYQGRQYKLRCNQTPKAEDFGGSAGDPFTYFCNCW